MSSTKIKREPANNSDCMSNVWPSGNHSIHKWTTSWCIWNILHVIGCIIIFGTIILGKLNMWLQWHSKRLSISHLNLSNTFSIYLSGDKCKVYCCLSLFIRIPRICSASPRSFIENAEFSCCFRAFRVLFFFPASSISSTYSTTIIGLPSSSFLV